jgi:hypothetical protein
MIHYLVTAAHQYTMDAYLRQSWSAAVRDRIRILCWEDLAALSELPRGAWIFSDLDRLDPEQRLAAAKLWADLAGSGRATRLCNHPERVLGRHALLRRMHEHGVNQFRAVRADADTALRFPVFVREEVEHTGSLTPLLATRAALAAAKAELAARGRRLHDLLVVEFCDTADAAGRYRRWSAFHVGGEIIPRYLTTSRDWVVKFRHMVVDAASVHEELDYVRRNPHADWLRGVFAAAGVDYGRIDYGMLDGQPQVFEINTNPMIGAPIRQGPLTAGRLRRQEQRLPITRLFYERFARALERLDAER